MYVSEGHKVGGGGGGIRTHTHTHTSASSVCQNFFATLADERRAPPPMYVPVHQTWSIVRSVPKAAAVADASVSSHAPPASVERSPAPVAFASSFAHRMQDARIRINMNMPALARRLALPVAQLAAYERGTDVPSDDVAKAIMVALEETADTFS